ncbi:hypothetical protein [Scytonema millei]|uniref:Uncharacterized protein n=1 Tax=Scytonema millei VB511283 TaxID=1245923 RepID=A0A9X5I723_9CYAN|nr:hypothetical protein [Scytonema millei]NHC37127.1 hypothetical protein [Scytonema millei VB511283]
MEPNLSVVPSARLNSLGMCKVFDILNEQGEYHLTCLLGTALTVGKVITTKHQEDIGLIFSVQMPNKQTALEMKGLAVKLFAALFTTFPITELWISSLQCPLTNTSQPDKGGLDFFDLRPGVTINVIDFNRHPTWFVIAKVIDV